MANKSLELQLPASQGKFNTTTNIMYYGGLTLVISGFTSSLFVLYLARNLNPCKKIHFDPILNKPQNASILKNRSYQLHIDNITQKHERDIINMQNVIRKSTKENKILETKLIEKSLANKILQHKLIELKKNIFNQTQATVYQLPIKHKEALKPVDLNNVESEMVDTILILANTN
jgi:hypothetical protein